jgi:hypothetical protein
MCIDCFSLVVPPWYECWSCLHAAALQRLSTGCCCASEELYKLFIHYPRAYLPRLTFSSVLEGLLPLVHSFVMYL